MSNLTLYPLRGLIMNVICGTVTLAVDVFLRWSLGHCEQVSLLVRADEAEINAKLDKNENQNILAESSGGRPRTHWHPRVNEHPVAISPYCRQICRV